MVDQIQVPTVPRPADRSANKVIYLVRAEDPEIKGKVQFYRAHKADRFATHLTVSGHQLTKTQAAKLVENPYANEVAGREINIELPWQKIISIENITYKRKSQGETNDNS